MPRLKQFMLGEIHLRKQKIGKLVKRNWHMNERRINLFIFCENEIVSSLLTMAVYLKLHGRV